MKRIHIAVVGIISMLSAGYLFADGHVNQRQGHMMQGQGGMMHHQMMNGDWQAHYKQMQAIMDQITNTKDPKERDQLMYKHMEQMHQGMGMMQGMMGMMMGGDGQMMGNNAQMMEDNRSSKSNNSQMMQGNRNKQSMMNDRVSGKQGMGSAQMSAEDRMMRMEQRLDIMQSMMKQMLEHQRQRDRMMR